MKTWIRAFRKFEDLLAMTLDRVDLLAAFRILDANLNRASEGLRTIEEAVRFRNNDSSQQLAIKQLRHDLTDAASTLDRQRLLEARNSVGDVGTANTTTQENSRSSIDQIVTAACERVQQALRNLEEFGKPVSSEFAQRVETIRYRAYELFAETQRRSATSKIAWCDARLYVLVDTTREPIRFSSHVKTLIDSGVDAIQIRDKAADGKKLLDYARLAVEIASNRSTRIVMNDRPDIAWLAGCDSIHVGQDDLSVEHVRQLFGRRLDVGLSTHTLQQALDASKTTANYIGCGPTFPSTTKTFDAFAGLDFLKEVAKHPTLPAFAIGGISLENIDRVLETGIQRVAVSGAVDRAEDPCAVCRELSRRLRH